MGIRMDWIAVSVDLPDHPKVLSLSVALGEERVEAYLIRLWAYCGRLVSGGILRGDSAEISAEKACQWRGERGRLVSAMVETGWLDRVSDGLAIHDWNDHAGRLIQKAEKERARKREGYQKAQKSLRGDSAEIPRKRRGDLRGDSADSPCIEVEVEREVDSKDSSRASAGQEQRSLLGEESKLALRPKKEADPRHKATIELWCRLWKSLRGGEYHVSGAKDGAAVKRLLSYQEATDAEIEKRIRHAFTDQWFRSNGTLAVFVSRWSTLEKPSVNIQPEKPRHPEIWRKLRPGEDIYADPYGEDA
jgi:hypothetical protein